MNGSMQMVDRRIPETVVLRIDHAASPERRKAFIERLEPILSQLNWRTHLFIVGEDPPDEMEFVRELIQALARFLVKNPFVSLTCIRSFRSARPTAPNPPVGRSCSTRCDRSSNRPTSSKPRRGC